MKITFEIKSEEGELLELGTIESKFGSRVVYNYLERARMDRDDFRVLGAEDNQRDPVGIEVVKAGSITHRITKDGKEVGDIVKIKAREFRVCDPYGKELTRTTSLGLAKGWAEGRISLLGKKAPWA